MKSEDLGFNMAGCVCTRCGRVLLSCSDSCLEPVVDKGPKTANESKKQSQHLTDVQKYQTIG